MHPLLIRAAKKPQAIPVTVVFNPTHFVSPEGAWVFPPSIKGTMLDSLKDQSKVRVEVLPRGEGLWTLLWVGRPVELWKEGPETTPVEDGKSRAFKD